MIGLGLYPIFYGLLSSSTFYIIINISYILENSPTIYIKLIFLNIIILIYFSEWHADKVMNVFTPMKLKQIIA